MGISTSGVSISPHSLRFNWTYPHFPDPIYPYLPERFSVEFYRVVLQCLSFPFVGKLYHLGGIKSMEDGMQLVLSGGGVEKEVGEREGGIGEKRVLIYILGLL